MADVVNLRQARKRKVRADKEARAAENRERFGRSKAERRREEAQRMLDHHLLDAARRDEREP